MTDTCDLSQNSVLFYLVLKAQKFSDFCCKFFTDTNDGSFISKFRLNLDFQTLLIALLKILINTQLTVIMFTVVVVHIAVFSEFL
jgi:hypothetical protein